MFYLLIEDVGSWGGMICDDGMFVRCNDLQFTVECSGKSIIGSAASGEGLVNIYREELEKY